MKLTAPKEPQLASDVPSFRREVIIGFLAAGHASGEPKRARCGVCNRIVDAQDVQSAGVEWSRIVTHLVGAHGAWWPDLDALYDGLTGTPPQSAFETAMTAPPTRSRPQRRTPTRQLPDHGSVSGQPARTARPSRMAREVAPHPKDTEAKMPARSSHTKPRPRAHRPRDERSQAASNAPKPIPFLDASSDFSDDIEVRSLFDAPDPAMDVDTIGVNADGDAPIEASPRPRRRAPSEDRSRRQPPATTEDTTRSSQGRGHGRSRAPGRARPTRTTRELAPPERVRSQPPAAQRNSARPRPPQPDKFGLYPSQAAESISSTYQIPAALAVAITETAQDVGGHPFDLANLINFETGGDFGRTPSSSKDHIGLLNMHPKTFLWAQIPPETVNSASAIEQLSMIATFFDAVRRSKPLDTPMKLAMAAFNPRAMDWEPDRPFPDSFAKNRIFEFNDGRKVYIRTPRDYMRLVAAHAALPFSDGTRGGAENENGGGSFFSQIGNALRNAFGGSGGDASQQPPANKATWELAPGAFGELVSDEGAGWPPGPIPPGRYVFVSRSGSQSPPFVAQGGAVYRASKIGRVFRVQ